MNSVTVSQTLLHEDCLLDTDESSPPESKQIRLDDGCNNNLSSMFNSGLQNSAKCPYSTDTSFVEPEILEEMGVGMLDDIVNYESPKKLWTQECTTSQTSLNTGRKFATSEINTIECHEEIHTRSVSDTIHTYSSRVEENTFTENMNSSTDNADLGQFYLYRRKRKASISGEDRFRKLSDEIILMILKFLPKRSLVRCMLVCKRWCQIARDEALWTRLDLGSKVLNEGTLGHILPRGVQILRLAQAEIVDPVFYENSEVHSNLYISKLQYLDLSMAVLSANGLATLLSKCKYLKKLSLEKCVLNRACCEAISQNTELEALNLTMCENMDVECIMDITKLKCLSSLNIAWCCLDSESMSLLCKTLPPSITRLNIAGCRKTMTDDNVKNLSRRCPDIMELDLSDCAILTMNAIHSLFNFTKLEHLSISRCYSIPQSAYKRLTQMSSLSYLDVFGLMSETVQKSLRNCREPQINKFLYSSVARPTVGIRRTSIWGHRVRD